METVQSHQNSYTKMFVFHKLQIWWRLSSKWCMTKLSCEEVCMILYACSNCMCREYCENCQVICHVPSQRSCCCYDECFRNWPPGEYLAQLPLEALKSSKHSVKIKRKYIQLFKSFLQKNKQENAKCSPQFTKIKSGY